jgi:VWFA-related protein
MRRRFFCALLLLFEAVRPSLGQTPAPVENVQDITILSPNADAYLSGRTTTRVRIEPESSGVVTFFIDGRQLCTVSNAPYECEWDAGPTVVAHQIRVTATLPNGRRLVRNMRTRGLSYAESADVEVIQVTATVSDGRGNYVRGLPKSVFHVFEDGRPQTITHFQSENIPLDLVVALDISSSMTAALPRLREAAKDFIGKVPQRDTVTVVGFNDNIFTLTRRSTDPAERVRAIDRLAAWGATALYDVIINSVEAVGRETGRKALVVFTDGEDQGSRARIEDVEAALQESDVTLYMIGQGRGTSLEEMKRVMRRLCEPTGGRALFTENIEALDAAFDELLEELSNQYLLGYTSTNTKRDGALRTIRVVVDGYSAVRARKSYRLARDDERGGVR